MRQKSTTTTTTRLSVLARKMESGEAAMDPENKVTEEKYLDFDENIWEAYESAINDVLGSKRVLKKDKPEALQEAKKFLLSRKCLSSIPSPLTRGEKLKEDIKMQKERFIDHYNLSPSQYNYVMRSLVYLGDYCAKRQRAPGILVAWEKLKESGILPRENSISTYMYILGSDETCHDTLMEAATFHDIFFSPNENTITLRIKHLIGKNQVKEAEEILVSLTEEKAGCKKLRTFLPILEHYCTTGNATAILRIFNDMQESSGVYFDSESYALILGSLAKFGHFCVDAVPIDGTTNSGPKLFDELASKMAHDILELSESAAQIMYNGFIEGFLKSSNSDEIPTITKQEDSNLVIGRVEVDDATALCPVSGARLRLIALDEDQRHHVHETLIKMAGMQYVEYTKNRKNTPKSVDDNFGIQQLSHFSEWLDTREGDPFTVIVDGPNVGFHGYGEFHYSQLEQVVQKLESMGEIPLVTMPQKYVSPSFNLRYGKRQKLSERDLDLVSNLTRDRKMYVVPARCLDDYYWMLGSISNQTNARQLADLQVKAGDKEGRFPGLRPMLVTNDQMRDHKLELLEPREFRRWCSCHIVNYDVAKVESDKEWDDRSVEFFPADFFSREIQGNEDESGNLVWHFPVSLWNEPSRFFISITQ